MINDRFKTNKKTVNKVVKQIVYPLAAVSFILILWSVASWIIKSDLLMPSFAQTMARLGELLGEAKFYSALFATTGRAIYSFIIALFFATVLTILAATNKKIKCFLSPLIIIVRAAPTIAIILVALVWLSGQAALILVAVLVVFPVLYAGFLSAIESVDPDLLTMAKAYKLSNKTIVKSVYLPTFTPVFIKQSGAGLSMNLKLIIASEVLAQTVNSIGMNMQENKIYLDTAGLFAWTFVAVIVGALLELSAKVVLALYERRLCK